MPTTNYNIPTIDPNGKIDVASDVNSALNAIDTALNTIDTALDGKAPTNHASSEPTYGIATEEQYGHIKLSDIYDLLTQDEIVIIGDSFSDTTARENLWPTYIPENYTVRNYAKSGAGFVSGTGGTFYSQAQAAVAGVANKRKVKTVIVYGGINDFGNSVSASDEYEAIQRIYDYLSAEFAYSNVIVICTNAGFVTREAQEGLATWISDIYRKNSASIKQVPLINAQYWLFGWATTDVFTDSLHPNQAGSNIIAKLMMQLVNGCYAPGSMWFTTAYTANGSDFKAFWNPNGDLYFTGEIHNLNFSSNGSVQLTTSTNSRWQKIYEVHNIAIPYRASDNAVQSIYMNTQTNTIYWFVTGSGTSSGILYF